MKQYCFMAAGIALLCSAVLAGCAEPPANGALSATMSMQEVSMKETPQTADAKAAFDALYESLSERETTDVLEDSFTGVFGFSPDILLEYYARISDPKTGLCDIAIIRPMAGQQEKVRAALYDYQLRCVEKYKDYDILNAHLIASDGVIYDQGEYIVMLLVEDTEAAREIIDRYIPQ